MTRMTVFLAIIALSVYAHVQADTPPMPVVPESVPINGWYHCNPSTLYTDGGDMSRDRDFYMETKQHTRKFNGQKDHSHSKDKAPRVKLGQRRHSNLPFLSQSLEATQQRIKTHKRKHGHKIKGTTDFDFSNKPKYECATFRVPMCYENICESNRTIDVFVKRVVASSKSQVKKSLWVLQGGPGASSTAMEDLMDTMYTLLDGQVSIYTMDHRGTARSNRLECQAAEAQTPGSPGGTTIVIDEVPQCIDDLLFKMDNQTAAYSVTSAAMDLRTIIEHTQSQEDVYVYGLSYGTYLVERLMHLAPDRVKGFIIDGIVAESGASIEERSTYSNWDHDVGIVADRFLAYCLKDRFCHSKFPHVSNLTTFVMDLYQRLDNDANHVPVKNPCADVLASTGQRPSYLLRTIFGEYLMSMNWRFVIPSIILRASRCTSQDVRALDFFVKRVSNTDESDDSIDLDETLFTSEMLYNLIVFSEMWERPTPDKTTLIQWYEQATMASDNYYTLPYYCLFTGSMDRACKELKNLPHSKPMYYERDQFWNQTASLPFNTSALLLSGGLDVQTRRMYGNLEYELLQGNRMLIQFEYAGHCTTFTTPTKRGPATCGAQILASFVRENGVLEKVDTSCIEDTYELSFQEDDSYYANALFGMSDLYD